MRLAPGQKQSRLTRMQGSWFRCPCTLFGPNFASASISPLGFFQCSVAPPPLCMSYAPVQAMVGVGTVLIWYLI